MLATIRRNTMRSAVLGLALASVVTTGALSASPAEAAAYIKFDGIQAETTTSAGEYEKASPKIGEVADAVVFDEVEEINSTKEITVTVRGELNGSGAVDPVCDGTVFPKVEIAETATFVDDIDKSSPKMTEDFEMTEDTGASRVTLTSATYECVIPKLEIAETTTSVDDIDKSSPKIVDAADAVVLDDYEEIKVTVRGELNGSGAVDPVFPKVEVTKPMGGATGIVVPGADEVHADTLKNAR